MNHKNQHVFGVCLFVLCECECVCVCLSLCLCVCGVCISAVKGNPLMQINFNGSHFINE